MAHLAPTTVPLLLLSPAPPSRRGDKKAAASRSPSRSSTLKGTFHSAVTVLVGPKEAQYVAHDSLLGTHSRFFHAACRSPFREGMEHIVRLPEEGPEQFEQMLEWIYTQKLPLAVFGGFDRGGGGGSRPNEVDPTDAKDATTASGHASAADAADHHGHADNHNPHDHTDSADPTNLHPHHHPANPANPTADGNPARKPAHRNDPGHQRDINGQYDALFRLYFLADHLQIPRLKNDVIDAVIQLERQSAFVPCTAQVATVLAETSRQNPLRRLLVDMHFWDVDPAFIEKHAAQFSKEFVLDLALIAMRCADRRPPRPRPYATHSRIYHEPC
ncbi:MAG: hypothetical protein M1826_004063 [Phylliscum demangeonii]|nr:MAG: hypothetical protein M1826_004063 [Phylliscum demangeonii]